jgi:hypothetical protein
MAVLVDSIWSRLVEDTFTYLDQTAAPFGSLWMPDHVQYGGHKVAEGWTLLTWALARYPDKLCGHEVLCNSFRNPAHLAKMAPPPALRGRVSGIGALEPGGDRLTAFRRGASPDVRAIELIRRCGVREYWVSTTRSGATASRGRSGATGDGAARRENSWRVKGHADQNYVWKGRRPIPHRRLKTHCRDVAATATHQQVVRVGILMENEREIERLKKAPGTRPLSDIQIVGTPAQVTETILGIIKQGARRLTVNFADVPRPEGTWLFASTVLPHL